MRIRNYLVLEEGHSIAHLLSGWPKKSLNFIFTTKLVFPKSLKFMNSGSEIVALWHLLSGNTNLCLPSPLPRYKLSRLTPKPRGSNRHEKPMGVHITTVIYLSGCGSKNRYQNGTLASGNMDQNLRNPSSLIF